MSRHENDDYFKVLLKRVESLAVENNQLNAANRSLDREVHDLRHKALRFMGAHEQREQAVAEINRMKKKHPKLVKLPAFMRPPSDDDIPF